MDPNRLFEFQLAKDAGATEVRFQAGWDKTESYADGELALGNIGPALAEARRLDLEVLIVAAYGPPRVEVGRFRVAEDVAAGATRVTLEGDLSAVEGLRSHVQRTDRGALVGPGREAYYGGLIHAVDREAGTIELAAALSGPLKAGDVLTVNNVRYASAATADADDPSVQAYARYVRFLADAVAAAGVTGRIEIWNEPPWANDRWDTRGAFYDDPPAGVLNESINAGFFNALRGDVLPDGVRYNWSGTHKSGFNSLLAGNVGETLTQLEAQRSFDSESFHPYGTNPEDAAYDTATLLSGVHFSEAALEGTNAGSNFKYARALSLINQRDAGWTLEQNITETGLTTDDAELKARYNVRQYLTYQALGFERVNFYRLAEPGGGYGFADASGVTNQAYEAVSGLVEDLTPLAYAPVDGDASPLVVDYAGTFPLTGFAVTGRHTNEQAADSLALAVWQRSYTEEGSWTELASPGAGTAVLQLPFGYEVDAVRNTVTREDLSYALDESTARITLQVTDDPLLVLLRPDDPDENWAPTADLRVIGASTELPVVFDARGSVDPDGEVAGYVWEFSDGVVLTGAQVARDFDVPGEVAVTLTVYDDGGRSATLHETVTLTGAGGLDGALTLDTWFGVSGNQVVDLTLSDRFDGPADRTQQLTSFESPSGVANSFGARTSGFLVPKVTGTYRLHLAADDAAQLWLSDDASEGGLSRVAEVTQYVAPREWDATTGQSSVELELVAGQAYAIEALHKDGGGGDHLAVGWSGPGIDGVEVIGARYLSTVEPFPFVGPPAPTPAPTPIPAPTPTPTPVPEPLPPTVGGVIGYEVFEALGGNDLDALTGSDRFPGSPDSVALLERFEAPANRGSQFGARLSGWLTPAVSGAYRFYLAADDQAELRLSSDSSSANAQAVAEVREWTPPRQWDQAAGQTSSEIELVAGQRYYIEALHKEGGGGDHVAVAWTGPGIAEPTVIDGVYLEAAETGGGVTPNPDPIPNPTPDPTPNEPPAGPAEGAGRVLRETWRNLSGRGLDAFKAELASGGAAEEVALLDQFASPSGDGAAYGSRLTTTLTPTASGFHRFFIAGDDEAELYIKEVGGAPPYGTPVARLERWSQPGDYFQDVNQGSAEIYLEAGGSYTLTALHVQGNGADHLSVAWTEPGETVPQVIAGSVLAASPPAGLPVAYAQYDPSAYDRVAGGETLGALDGIDPLRTGFTDRLGQDSLPTQTASRLTAVWQPAASGSIRLAVAADDRAVLYLRREGELDWVAMSRVTDFTAPHAYAAEGSMWFSVQAGERYELELWHEQGGGPGHVSVGVQLNADAGFVELSPQELSAWGA